MTAAVDTGSADGFAEVLTRQVFECLLAAARTGASRYHIALACRVRPKRLEEWLTRGSEPGCEDAFAIFAAEFLQLEASYALQAQRYLDRAMQDDGRIAAKFIEDRYGHELEVARKLDPLTAGAARVDKKAELAKLVKSGEPEFMRLLLENGALEHLLRMRSAG